MKIPSSIRRIGASALLAAGLAYPACAAVCPKGIGGCPSPGRCFLYVDADTNSLCDYTGRTGSQPAGGAPSNSAIPARQTVEQAQATATVQATPGTTGTATVLPADPAGTGSGASAGILDTLHLSVPLAEIILFIAMTGIFLLLFRRGIAGIKEERSRPSLALAALFGLGTSLMLTCILAGESVAGTTCALVYMAGGTLLAAYLWYSGSMTRGAVLATALLSTLAGFVFLAPIMPMELGGIVNVLTGLSAPTAGTIVIGLVILSALVAGRVFCGAVCPVGSLQELAYAVPSRKVTVRRTWIPELVRIAVFAVTVIAAIYLVDVMAYAGLYDLFSLTLSAAVLVAAGLVIVSVFLYRPVCRVLCPFGFLFSLPAAVSLFRIRRTETCTDCMRCRTACPARVAGRDDPKRECYLCGRCIEACPEKTGVAYGR